MSLFKQIKKNLLCVKLPGCETSDWVVVLHQQVVIDLFICGCGVGHVCCEICGENGILVCAVRNCLLQLEMFKP